MASNVDGLFQCPFCPCVFSSQHDLDSHLKAFGNVPHQRLSLCVAILSEVDGHEAGVDSHGDWRRDKSDRLFNPKTIRACRALVEKCKMMRTERSDESGA
jgi:hypothetical protein